MRTIALLALLLAWGCADVGALDNPCFENDTCNDELVCLAGTCAVRAPVVIDFFAAAPLEVEAGDEVTFSWSAQNADECRLGSNIVGAADTATVAVVETTDFVLTCSAPPDDVALATVTVTVVDAEPAPLTVSLEVDDATLELGDSATLSWVATGADSCALSDGATSSDVDLEDSEVVSPTTDTTFTLTCDLGDESLARSVTISVLRAPSVDTFTSSGDVRFLEDVLLSWTTTDAAACELEYDGVRSDVGLTETDLALPITTRPLADAVIELRCFGALEPSATSVLTLPVEEVVVDGDVTVCSTFQDIACTPLNDDLSGVNRITGALAVQSLGTAIDLPQLTSIAGDMSIIGANVPVIRFANLEEVGDIQMSSHTFETNNAPLPDEFDFGPIEFPALAGGGGLALFNGFDADAIRFDSATALEVFDYNPSSVVDKCVRFDFSALRTARNFQIRDARSDLVGAFPVFEAVFDILNVSTDTGMSQGQLDAEFAGVDNFTGSASITLTGAVTPTCP